MRYYTLFTLLTYLSVLVGVGGVALSERQVVYLVMTLIACALTWPSDRLAGAARQRRRRPRPAETPAPGPGAPTARPRRRAEHQVPWPVRALVTGAILAYALVDFLLLGADPVVSLAHLLNFAMVLKLTTKKGPRDYLQIYLMALFSMIVAGYLSAHVTFGVILLAFVVVTGWALMLLVTAGQAHVWVKSSPDDYAPRALDDDRAAGLDEAIPTTCARFLRRTARHSLALFVPAILFFLLVPRGGLATVRLPQSARYESITGFSERVQLGEVASILQNPAPVMRVQLIDPRTNQPMTHPRVALLWRGITLDEYKKTRTWGWRNTRQDQRPYAVGRPVVDPLRIGQRPLIRQRIVLQALDSPVLFALAPLVRVRRANVGDMQIGRDDQSLRMVDPPAGLRQYEVVSALHRRPLEPGWAPDRGYLQVPPEIQEELHRFAERIAPDDVYPTPLAKARAMVRYFHASRFAYSLTYRGTPGAEPVTDFLTKTRKGHCELFASAMALMLRTQDVATRVVNGFRGGEWNALGQFLLVRQEDAHTWVEAYLPGQGWDTFDPTPGSSRPRPMPGGSLFGYVGQAYDYLKWSWLQHVLRYDRYQQRGVLRRITDVAAAARTMLAWNRRTIRQAWSAWERAVRRAAARIGLPTPTGTGFTVIVTALGALVVAVPLVVAARRLRRRRDRPIAPILFYETLLRRLERLGFSRQPAQTPLEFALQVASAGPASLRVVPWITQQYYGARFGGKALPPSVRARIREGLDELAALISKRHRAAPAKS